MMKTVQIGGSQWEVVGAQVRRFRLKGYPIWVEWCARGWFYYWEGGNKTGLFWATREAAMNACVECLEETISKRG
jgi:hypothetical protein